MLLVKATSGAKSNGLKATVVLLLVAPFPLLEHLATVLGCVASWEDERVLRRPEEEDRRGRGKGDAQDRSRTDLRRGYLLSQALRRHGPRGEAPRSEETPGSKPKLDEGARKLLEADLRERPAATLPQRREFLRRVCGMEVSDSTVSRVLKRLGWSRKKDRWVRASATSG